MKKCKSAFLVVVFSMLILITMPNGLVFAYADDTQGSNEKKSPPPTPTGTTSGPITPEMELLLSYLGHVVFWK